ncbi:MAG TPA: DoxX family protein [Ktedonosporobacter sp.]|nr:DoxX family protein [Ktedonosporobacter sp.]
MIDAMHPKMVTKIPRLWISKFFFANTWMAWLWLIVRLYVGYQWLTAGWEKLTGYSIKFTNFGQATGSAPWIFGNNDGGALTAYLQHAISLSQGSNASVQPWYAAFLRDIILPNAGICSYIVTFGEILVGLGLIFGCLTGVAAFFGLLMNLMYLMAGTVSTNVILGVLSLLLVMAWRIAGYYGIDQQLMPVVWGRRLRDMYSRANSPVNIPPDVAVEASMPSLKVSDSKLKRVSLTRMNEVGEQEAAQTDDTSFRMKPDK